MVVVSYAAGAAAERTDPSDGGYQGPTRRPEAASTTMTTTTETQISVRDLRAGGGYSGVANGPPPGESRRRPRIRRTTVRALRT